MTIITKLAVLLDPDKEVVNKVFNAVTEVVHSFPRSGAGLPLELWVGSSHDFGGNVRRYLHKLYQESFHTDIPIVIFPGHPFQLSREADWIMYPTLLNNHSTLIKIIEKVGKLYCWIYKSVFKLFRRHFPEMRPFGYFVVDEESSVGRKLKAKAYEPKEAVELIKNHFDPKWTGVYCEGGSGADRSIADHDLLLKETRAFTSEKGKIMYAGGGIRSENDIKKLCNLNIDIIVVSTVFEESKNPKDLIKRYLNVIQENNTN